MKIDDIRDVTRSTGVLPPKGTKYVPESKDQLRAITSKVRSHGATGIAGGTLADLDHQRFDFLTFYLNDKQFYVDLLTVDQDIRASRIADLVTDIPFEDL
jgi:hypothetical protein